MEKFLHSELVRGVVVALAGLALMFGYFAILLALPDSVRRKLFRQPRPPKPPSAFSRRVDGFLKKHGGLVGAFVAGTALAAVVETTDRFWSRALILGLALRLASALGDGHYIGSGGQD